MKKILIIGQTGCGKTTLSQRLLNEEIRYKKTQSVEVLGDVIIDTPGEYVQSKQFYRALVVTAVEADYILMLQDSSEDQCSFSPMMKGMFNKPIIGVMTKIDLSVDKHRIAMLEELLTMSGAERIFHVSSTTGEGIKELSEFLES